jgi:hypothetical protein
MLIEDPNCGLGKLDGDCLASMAEADLDALARDLDATAAGDPPLDGQIAFWQRVGSSEADALEPVPFTTDQKVGVRVPPSAPPVAPPRGQL